MKATDVHTRVNTRHESTSSISTTTSKNNGRLTVSASVGSTASDIEFETSPNTTMKRRHTIPFDAKLCLPTIIVTTPENENLPFDVIYAEMMSPQGEVVLDVTTRKIRECLVQLFGKN